MSEAEAVEFDVPEAGAPALGDESSPYDQQASAQQATALRVVVGWTPEEAAEVVGGMVANITLLLYAMRWHAPPPIEIVPAIAGDPRSEFPLMGAGLAPVLDFLAPKGSAAAVGVSLTAGVGEIVGAIARRAPVLEVPPKQEKRPAPPPAAPQERPPAQGSRFRYTGEPLRVLQAGEAAYEGLGVPV